MEQSGVCFGQNRSAGKPTSDTKSRNKKIDKDVPIRCINFPDRFGDSSLFKNRQRSWNQGIFNGEI